MAAPSSRVWVRRATDDVIAAHLSTELRIDTLSARLLAMRGISDPLEARSFFEPRLTHLPDPSLLLHLDATVVRLADAIERGENIALYGDYDVDGVTSMSVLATFLRQVGVDPRIYVPKRLTEGYGLNRDAVDALAHEGTQLLVTLDCGITSSDEIARARAHGMATIVIDHHRCPPELPPAFSVVNPHQPGCPYPDKGLAAVGLAFNVLVGLRRELRRRGRFNAKDGEPDLRSLLDLVALGTIADMVPLRGVNRIFAWHGLKELRRAARPGIRALFEVARVRASRSTSSDVAFRLAPRINAAGRLDDARVGVALLLEATIDRARDLAATLDAANASRQRIEQSVFESATHALDATEPLPAAIVIDDPAWHPGVVGIVASKLVERYGRPTIVIGEGGRGSGRTAGGLHLYDAITAVCDRVPLLKFGGHAAAAGLTIDRARIPAFREEFLRIVRQTNGDAPGQATLHYDDELEVETIDESTFVCVERFAPFGMGNPEPLFRVPRARIKTSRPVGKGHVKMRLYEGPDGGLEAIAFRADQLAHSFEAGQEVELAVHLDRSEFSGVEALELRVKDARPLQLTP